MGKKPWRNIPPETPSPNRRLPISEDTGTVLYRSGMTHGSNKKNFEIFTAERFIAAITQRIPEKNFQVVRYYGCYSTRNKGDSKHLKTDWLSWRISTTAGPDMESASSSTTGAVCP